MHENWIADRMKLIEVSGIRKVFDLAAHLKDPVNLSIGMPHFPVPTPIKEATNKAIIVNSPANPTGVVHAREVLRDLANLARARDILLMSDEVYRAFCYDGPFASPLEFNDDTLVLDGFSKAYSMTGWRLGYAH